MYLGVNKRVFVCALDASTRASPLRRFKVTIGPPPRLPCLFRAVGELFTNVRAVSVSLLPSVAKVRGGGTGRGFLTKARECRAALTQN